MVVPSDATASRAARQARVSSVVNFSPPRTRRVARHAPARMRTPASGKTFRIEAVDIIRLRDDKMVEHWGVMDVAGGMSAQLGLTP